MPLDGRPRWVYSFCVDTIDLQEKDGRQKFQSKLAQGVEFEVTNFEENEHDDLAALATNSGYSIGIPQDSSPDGYHRRRLTPRRRQK